MKKYTFFVILLLSFFAACKNVIHPVDEKLSDMSIGNSVGSDPPNIILIVADDVGYQALGCDGGQLYKTPNLDKMAAQGRRFTQCHASPLCSPSRFALLTGKYNFRNYTKWGRMDPALNKTIGNMFEDAGYSTCYSGKWQLDGYDASITALGWQAYSVWQPAGIGVAGSRYKNPHIYQDGVFLPDGVTQNKYADDMFIDYITSFMDTATKPYFIYYSMSLVHAPFSPTPDDPEFANWDPNNSGDPKFFPSMVKYMDKKIGELLNTVPPNTVIIYVGDNGSPLKQVDSSFDGDAKGSCTEYGTRVPLIMCKVGSSLPSVDTSLIDLTDFMPTLASIAKIPVPQTYGTLDGISFYPKSGSRAWIYYHYNELVHPEDETTIWVQNGIYKKYDSTVRIKDIDKRSKLFNIRLDPDELHPILRRDQTSQEKIIDSTFRSIIHSYAKQQ